LRGRPEFGWGEGGLPAALVFAVRQRRRREVGGRWRWAGRAGGGGEGQVGGVGGIGSVQGGRAVRGPSVQIEDPNDTIGSSTGRNGRDRAAGRERVGGNRRLRCRHRAIRNRELAQWEVLPRHINVSVPIGRQSVDAAVQLGCVGRRNRDHLLHILVRHGIELA